MLCSLQLLHTHIQPTNREICMHTYMHVIYYQAVALTLLRVQRIRVTHIHAVSPTLLLQFSMNDRHTYPQGCTQ